MREEVTMAVVIEVASRPDQDVTTFPKIAHLYPRAEDLTVVLVTGTLRSGKTEVVRALVAGLGNNDVEISAHFNERRRTQALQDAERMPRQIKTSAYGGCGCCRVYPKIKDAIGTDFVGGAKVALVEQSGFSNGARFRDNLVSDFGKHARVRFIAIVDATLGMTTPAKLAIVAADLVLVTKTSGRPDLVAKATKMIEEIRGTNAVDIHVQGFAGDLPVESWNRLLLPPSARRTGLGLSMASATSSKTDEDERRWLRDHTSTLIMQLRSGVTLPIITGLIESYKERPIVGAKGWVAVDGGYQEFDYALGEGGRGTMFPGRVTTTAPTVYGGRPFIQMTASLSPPDPVHFMTAAKLFLDRIEVQSYLDAYPPDDEIEGLYQDEEGVPSTFEGDDLAVQAMTIAPATNKLADDERREFATAFVPLITRYCTARFAALKGLWKESTNPKAFHAERMLEVGMALAYVRDRFPQLDTRRLPNGKTFLEAINESRPASCVFEGLGRMTRLEVSADPSPSPNHMANLCTCAVAARQNENYPKQKILDAAKKFADLALRLKNQPWIDFTTELLAKLEAKVHP